MRTNRRNRTILLALVATGVGAGVTIAAGRAAYRRWCDADDPCGPDIAALPDGEAFTIVTDDDATISGVVVGTGPTVVLSHCWTGNRTIWAPVTRRLVESGHEVVLYDQRGHGASTMGRAPVTVERLGDDLAAVLEQVDRREVVLAGHSMGGMSVQAYVTGHPDEARDRVRAIVLVATAAATDRGMIPTRGPLRGIVGSRFTDRALAGRYSPVLVRGVVGRSPRWAHLALTRDTFVATAPEVRRDLLDAFAAMDYRPLLPSIDIPTTVVIASRDTLTPAPVGRVMAGLIPGARIVEIPGCGHMIPLEAPELLADLIATAHLA